MNAFEVVCSSQDREKWLTLRREGLGASEAAAVLGASPWASPMSVYADKVDAVELDTETSEAAEWGLLIEPLIIRKFADETGRVTSPFGQLIRSIERPWQMATVDAGQYADKYEGPGLLECKVTTIGKDWDEGMPQHVHLQVQHQFAVTGYQWGSVAALLCGMGGMRFVWMDVKRDDALIEKMIEGESEFWRRVVALEPPAPDGHPATLKALKALYPTDDGTSIELPGELYEVDNQRCTIKEQIKTLEKDLVPVDNALRAAIGEHSAGTLGQATYHLKANKKGVRSLRRTESNT